jgi:uncharacterized protein YndB with AHSA1/START domain
MNPLATLKVTTPSDREIAMTRVFNAPRRLVFDAVTKPEQVKRWLLGPPGWTMPVCEIDLRVGGAYRYLWHGPNDARMGIRGVFREIASPGRIVVTEKFDQAWYPGGAMVTTELTELSGRTMLTLTVLYESKDARDAVLKTPMSQGVGMSYDRLEEVLASSGHPEREKGTGA